MRNATCLSDLRRRPVDLLDDRVDRPRCGWHGSLRRRRGGSARGRRDRGGVLPFQQRAARRRDVPRGRPRGRWGARVGLGVDGAASNEAGDCNWSSASALHRSTACGPRRCVHAAGCAPPRDGGWRSPPGADDIGVSNPATGPTWSSGPATISADVPDPLAGLVLGPDRRARHVAGRGTARRPRRCSSGRTKARSAVTWPNAPSALALIATTCRCRTA